MQHDDYCSPGSKELFETIITLGTTASLNSVLDQNIFVSQNRIQGCIEYCIYHNQHNVQFILFSGYEIFEPKLPLRRVAGCDNKYLCRDLLLIHAEFLKKWSTKNNVTIAGVGTPYHKELLSENFFLRKM